MIPGKIQEQDNDLVLSFLAVRQCLGYLGLMLPVALLVGAHLFHRPVEPSISGFYYTQMTDIFVGTLAAIGVFLYAYKGYRKRPGEWISDGLIARAAGTAAIVVALVPTTPRGSVNCSIIQCLVGPQNGATIHYGAALLFFSMLAVFCLWMFPKSTPHKRRSPQKLRRNRIYYGCGTVLLVAMAGILIYFALLPKATQAALDRVAFLFWLESLGVWAFGISWLVKGRAIGMLNDRQEGA